jgi:hypothetical protein
MLIWQTVVITAGSGCNCRLHYKCALKHFDMREQQYDLMKRDEKSYFILWSKLLFSVFFQYFGIIYNGVIIIIEC